MGRQPEREDLLTKLKDYDRRLRALESGRGFGGEGAGARFLGHALVQASNWTNAPGDGWEDWGGSSPLSVTVSKALAGTWLLVGYGYSLYRDTASGEHNYAIHESVGNARYGTLQAYINGLLEHEGFTGTAPISGLATGNHTLKLQVDNAKIGGNVNTDNTDYGWMYVLEVPG